ncbi:type II secretion system F family protein [Castellaniella daejeonensis]|jgi:tight adherence protein B|uniref:Type II secretion system F family protein n=1 Tax=Castellaniella daejeonensis TaxID=659013 RepID=A0ABP3DAS2_9BURK|nr:type II secretion system F family protein [Castellaniella sp.]HET8703399.1 type II secretion system F family protein [Castellaniella sp.]
MDILIFAGFSGSIALAVWWLLGWTERAWARYEARMRDETRRTLDASFLFLDMAQLRPAAAALGLALMLTVAWMAGRWWGVLPVLAGLLCAPPLILRHMRQRRAQRFDAQLPDLVQALAGALRAGAGVQPALRHLVAQSSPPLSQEFGLLLREQRLGLGFQDALQQLRIRMPTESCGLVVSALGIAARTGGGLADTLEGIAQTLRARQHWLGRVEALTAQGRMQSRIMAGLPAALALVLVRLEPEAMALMWQTWYGWLVLSAILVLEGVGIVWIRRVSSIEV